MSKPKTKRQQKKVVRLGGDKGTEILGHLMAQAFTALVKLHRLGVKVKSEACRDEVYETIFGRGGAFDWFAAEPPLTPDAIAEIERLTDKTTGFFRAADVLAWAKAHQQSALHRAIDWKAARPLRQLKNLIEAVPVE